MVPYRSRLEEIAQRPIDELFAAARGSLPSLAMAATALQSARDGDDACAQAERDRLACAAALQQRIGRIDRDIRQTKNSWNATLTQDPAANAAAGAKNLETYEQTKVLIRSAIEYSTAILRPTLKLASLRAAVVLNAAERQYVLAQQLPRIREFLEIADKMREVDHTAATIPLAADSLPSVTAAQLGQLELTRYDLEKQIADLCAEHFFLNESESK
jgi:hypothetical protein